MIPKIDLSDYQPLPSQAYLHQSKADFRCYIGTFGSGKTKWLIYETLMLSMEYPVNYGMVLRATYPELDDTILSDYLAEIPEGLVKRWEKTKRRLTLINGSRIVFRSFDKLKKIKSLNIGFFAIDQGEEIDVKHFLALASRLRLAAAGRRCGLVACNYKPNNWTLKMFTKDKRDDPRYDFVVANTSENTYLPNDYIERLRDLYPESWINRYVELDLDKLEAEANPTVFRFKDEQYVPVGSVPYIEETEPEHPEWYRFVVGIDAGVGAPSAVLFAVVDLQAYYTQEDGLGQIYFFHEIYERGLDIEKVSYLIKAGCRKYKLWRNEHKRVWQYIIDPSTNRRQQGRQTTESVFSMFRGYGINVVPGINDRAYGILRMRNLVEKGIIKVADTLENFRIEAEGYQFDIPDSVDDIGADIMVVDDLPKRKQRDHLLDCARYIISKLPMHWFSLQLKYKDAKSRETLEHRSRHKGGSSRIGLNLARKSNARKERWAMGERL